AETDVLKTVPIDHPDRVPAVKRLAEILMTRNRTAEAAQLVSDVLRDNEAGRSDVELHDLLAVLFDKLGQGAQAERLRLRAERLRARQPAAVIPDAIPDAESAPAPEEGYRLLKSIPIFGRLAMPDMRDLYRLATEQQWTPGQQIVESG